MKVLILIMAAYLALSDTVWTAIVGGIVAVMLAFIQVLTLLLTQRNARQAAEKVESVKRALQDSTSATEWKLKSIAATGEKVHVLVNSRMGAVLQLSARQARRIANITKDTPEGAADNAAADEAESLLKEHESKQQIVDGGGTVQTNERK
jgi:hypothetical protein